MNIFPIRQETIVSRYKASEVIQKLKKITATPTLSKKEIDPLAVFIGNVNPPEFRVSVKVDAPENFLPIILGSVDETSMGCIVFLKFKLFFSSLMFLIFWSSIAVLVSLFFFLVVDENIYGIVALSMGLVNYLITFFYFQRKAKESYSILMRELKMLT